MFSSWSSQSFARMCMSTDFPPRQLQHGMGFPMLSLIDVFIQSKIIEPTHDKTNQMACASSEDSDQPGHPPSLIRVFAVRMKKAWVLSYPLSAHGRLWSDWADAQADLSLRWVHSHCVVFLVRWLYEWLCPRVWARTWHGMPVPKGFLHYKFIAIGL